MAHRYRTNGTLSNQTRLPPIRGRCGLAQKAVSLASENRDYSPLVSLLKLPRVESRSTVNSKAPLSFKETEQNQISFKSYETMNDNFLPFRQAAAKQGTGSIEKFKGLRGANRHEERDSSAHHDSLGGGYPGNAVTIPIAEKVFRRPVQLLRRRLKPGKAYQHRDDQQMSHNELLSFEQNMDQMRAFTERDKMIEVKDFKGQKIDPNKTGNSDITSYIAMFEVQSRENKSPPTEKTCADEETNVRVRGRFYEALDDHFYHYYRNTHPERRMAICEEIERRIVVDDLALTCFREHLSLQDVMNTWML